MKKVIVRILMRRIKMVMVLITVLIRFPCCVLLALPWNNTLDSIAVSIFVDVVVELTNTELSIIFKSTTIVCNY